MSRRVAITGLGCVTPVGHHLAATWSSFLAGRSGVGPITHFDASRFPVRIAAEVKDWSEERLGTAVELGRNQPRQTQFTLAATQEAVAMSCFRQSRVPPDRIGVYLGCGETFPELEGLGSMLAEAWRNETFLLSAFENAARTGSLGVDEFQVAPDQAATIVSSLVGAEGPSINLITGCTSATQAIGNAAALIRRGDADVMVAGGGHSLIHPLGVSGLIRLSVLTTANELGSQAMRPFDVERRGFVVGEGAGILILEEYDHALRRGAEILAELIGYGCAHDAYHLTDLDPDSRGFRRCVEEAFRDAQISPEQIDYANAHGTSTVLNDRLETIGLKRCLGEHARRIPISSIKSMIGHTTTACGAIDAIATVMSLRTGMLPPTINHEHPDPECDLDCVPNTAREHPCRIALSHNFGFGGHNAALVLRRV